MSPCRTARRSGPLIVAHRNMNVYGQQADDSGAKGNDYNEAI